MFDFATFARNIRETAGQITNPWAPSPDHRTGAYEGDATVLTTIGPENFYPGNRPYDLGQVPDPGNVAVLKTDYNRAPGAQTALTSQGHFFGVLAVVGLLLWLARK